MAQLSQKIVYGQIPQRLLLSLRQKPLVLFCVCLLVSQVSNAFLVRSNLVNENSGIAFGIFTDSPALSFLLVVLAFLFLGLLVWRRSYLGAPLALVLAGGASNGLDRLVFGFVRDPIHILAWSGNLADVLIGIGMLWSIWRYIKK